MSYIPALSWSGAIRLTTLTDEGRWREKAQREMQPFISGEKPSIVEPYQLTSLAGSCPAVRSRPHCRRAKGCRFDSRSNRLTRFVSLAGGPTTCSWRRRSSGAWASLSDDGRYPRAIARLSSHMEISCSGRTGCFIHAVVGPHAWRRGNGFAALGLVEALTHLPARWSERPRVSRSTDATCARWRSISLTMENLTRKRGLISRAARDGGHRNRRLATFSFGFLNGTRENRGDCAQKCAQTGVPKTGSKPTIQSTRVVAFSVKGDGLNVGRLHLFRYPEFPCKCLCHVYLQVCGEVAEWPKAAVC